MFFCKQATYWPKMREGGTRPILGNLSPAYLELLLHATHVVLGLEVDDHISQRRGLAGRSALGLAEATLAALQADGHPLLFLGGHVRLDLVQRCVRREAHDEGRGGGLSLLSMPLLAAIVESGRHVWHGVDGPCGGKTEGNEGGGRGGTTTAAVGFDITSGRYSAAEEKGERGDERDLHDGMCW